MEKSTAYLAAFIVVLCLTYLACCYMVAGWRIKLDADAATYFFASIKSMVLIKGIISSAAGLLAGAVLLLFSKSKTKYE